jgi:hypothetical protein
VSHRHIRERKAFLEHLQDDPVALFHHDQLTSTNLVPMALSPCGRADWKETGYVTHQADAPHTVKHF